VNPGRIGGDPLELPRPALRAGSPLRRGGLVDALLAGARFCPTKRCPFSTSPERARAGGARFRCCDEGVAEVVAELADLPIERLLETDQERMLALESVLGERVVGHKKALARIAHVLRRNAAGFRGGRPIGTFLLLGPTGVGKTRNGEGHRARPFFNPSRP